jgi:hypothetical protein
MKIPIIDLASVVNLRTVAINQIHMDEPSHLVWLHATVSSVHSTQLNLIKLDCNLLSISSLSQNVHELGAIDELLGSYKLKNLNVQLSVRLRFAGNIPTGDVANEFRSVLPRSMKNGILKFYSKFLAVLVRSQGLIFYFDRSQRSSFEILDLVGKF